MTEPIEQNYDWLIIFLVYNNNYYDLENQDTTEYYTMKEQTKYILNQIRYTGYNKTVKTIFVEAQIKNSKPPERDTEGSTASKPKNPAATLSMLYKKEGTWLSAVDRIWRNEEVVTVLTSEESLQDVLIKLKKRYNANKHMIITAGHGSIIGINYYIPELIQKSSRENIPDVENILKRETGFSDDATDEEKIDAGIELEDGKRLFYLANREISTVLKNVFTDKKLDILVMYNCLMQNIFTQFDLKDTVDWLVAPLSGISIPGFNYQMILNEISKDPGISPEKVSELFTSTIRKGNRYSKYMNDIENTWKIAACKMDKEFLESIQDRFDILLTEISNLGETGKDISRDINNCIKATLRFLFNYAFYCLKSHNTPDLGVFLEFFKEKITSEYNSLNPILPKIDDLQALLKNKGKSGIYLFEGYNFYQNGEGHKEDESRYKDSISNIALFFPYKKFHSNLIEGILNSNNYPDGKNPGQNNPSIPGFLKTDKYALTVSNLLK